METTRNQLKEGLTRYTDQEVSYIFSDYSDVQIAIQHEIKVLVGDINILEFDLVYFRKTEKVRPIAVTLAHYLKVKNKKFIDSGIGNATAGSKLIQLMILALNGINITPTLYVHRSKLSEKFEEALNMFQSPVIIKATSGRKGKNILLVSNKDDIQKILVDSNENLSFLYQKYIPNQFDYRLLVLGDTARVAIKRTRQDPNKYVNNASQGAKEEFFDPKLLPKEIIDMAEKSASVLQRQVAGVDIIVNEDTGEPYILEANPAPGFTYDMDEPPEVKALANYLQSF